MDSRTGFEQFIAGLPPEACIVVAILTCIIVVLGNQLPPNYHWPANLGFVAAPFTVYVWMMNPERSSTPLLISIAIVLGFAAWWLTGGQDRWVHKNDRDPYRHHH